MYYYEVNIKPVFIKGANEYPFTGLIPGPTAARDYQIIVDTLRNNLGADLDIKESIALGKIEIAVLSAAQMNLLRILRADTGETPTRQLKFVIGVYIMQKIEML
jgi:hypothetical protein